VTYTFAELEISAAAYDEIAARLRAADYGHVFVKDGLMDMHGIALSRAPDTRPKPTIAELESILMSEDDRPVMVNADGSVTIAESALKPYRDPGSGD
jgi:hypothetical protein